MTGYLGILTHKYIVRFLFHRRRLSKSCSVVGRDYISPDNFTSEELKTVLWTAVDLKTSKDKCLEILHKPRCNVTVLMSHPYAKIQLAITTAVHNLGFHPVVVIDEEWGSSSCISDLGRALSKLTNVIVTVGLKHELLKGLCDGAAVPVVNFSSTMHSPVEGLANLLTVQEHYCFLRNLTLGWVGPWSPNLNTYLSLCPKFGMNLQFVTTEDLEQSHLKIKGSINTAIECGGGVNQAVSVAEAIYRAHVIATTEHNCEAMRITRKMLREAAVDWTLLHNLPRSQVEVGDDVFLSKNNLAWKSCENVMWVMTAIFLQLMEEYKPGVCQPDFDGCNVPLKKYYQR